MLKLNAIGMPPGTHNPSSSTKNTIVFRFLRVLFGFLPLAIATWDKEVSTVASHLPHFFVMARIATAFYHVAIDKGTALLDDTVVLFNGFGRNTAISFPDARGSLDITDSKRICNRRTAHGGPVPRLCLPSRPGAASTGPSTSASAHAITLASTPGGPIHDA